MAIKETLTYTKSIVYTANAYDSLYPNRFAQKLKQSPPDVKWFEAPFPLLVLHYTV